MGFARGTPRSSHRLASYTISVFCSKPHHASALAQIGLGSSKHMTPVSYPHDIITYKYYNHTESATTDAIRNIALIYTDVSHRLPLMSVQVRGSTAPQPERRVMRDIGVYGGACMALSRNALTQTHIWVTEVSHSGKLRRLIYVICQGACVALTRDALTQKHTGTHVTRFLERKRMEPLCNRAPSSRDRISSGIAGRLAATCVRHLCHSFVFGEFWKDSAPCRAASCPQRKHLRDAFFTLPYLV